MKKTYRKPAIFFEDFSLTTNIAAGCEVQTDTPSWNQCGVSIGGGTYAFIEGVSQCNWKITPNEEGIIDFNGDKMCYHVPIETNNLFNS